MRTLRGPLPRIAQHLEDAAVQIPDGAFEIEVRENDGSNHAAIEIGRDELRHPVGIDGLEQPLLYP